MVSMFIAIGVLLFHVFSVDTHIYMCMCVYIYVYIHTHTYHIHGEGVCVCVYIFIYHIFFIHLSVDRHLGCFHVLASVNSAARNTGVHVSLI